MRVVAPLALFALAVAVRALPWPTVFAPGGVHPTGPDAYYHLRRIWYTVHNFPDFLAMDRYVNFPEGARAIWTPVFDWCVAALAWVVVGDSSQSAVEALAVWVPPVLGGATVVVVFRLALGQLGTGAALVSALVLAVLPAHFWYSQLGFVDHHVAVALVTTLLLAAAMNAVSRDPRSDPHPRRTSVALGLAMAASLLVWPGCLLHVAIVQAALGVRLLACSDVAEARPFSRRFALAHAVACAGMLPLSVGNRWGVWGNASPLVLSNFQPLYLGAGAVAFALLALWWGRAGANASRRERAGAILVAGTGALGLVFLAGDGLGSAVGQALGWFARAEEFQALVAESGPLFWNGSGFDPSVAERVFSRAIYAVPVLVVALGLALRRQGGRPELWLVIGWAVVLLGATLAQRRFMNSFSVAYALLLGAASQALGSWIARRVAGRPGTVGVCAAVALAAAAVALPPVAVFYQLDTANLGRALRGEPLGLRPWQRTQRALIPVGQWLAKNTPETAGYLDSEGVPEYAVLAPWGDGHALRYTARRPMVQDGFGDDVGPRNFLLAEAYFAAAEESRALEILEELGVRYVVVRGTGSGHSRGYGPRSLFVRLQRLRGTSGSFEGPKPTAAVSVEPLLHHRMILDTQVFGERPDAPRFKVFEVVAGARVVGRAAPGATVEARLPIRLGREGRFLFTAGVRADADGRYAMTLPYATDAGGDGVAPHRRYTLRSGELSAPLAVPDAAVLGGETLAGPTLVP